jgi:hypothetical protein
MRGAKLEQWESCLKTVFEKIDDILEEQYGSDYPIHPSRAKFGTTSSGKYDGLFHVDAAYSAGYGSKLGEGYVLEVRMVTLTRVPNEIRKGIEEQVVGLLHDILPEAFPDTTLNVMRDGNVYKIVGDLALD